MGFGNEEKAGGDFYVFKALKSNLGKLAGRLLPHPRLLQRLKSHIDTIKPDVIHLHNVKQYTATVLKAIKTYPVVHTTHDFSLICPTSQNIHQNLLPCKTGLRKECFWQHQVKFNRINYLIMSLAWRLNKARIKNTAHVYISPSPLLKDYLHLNQFKPAHYIPPFIPPQKAINTDKIDPYRFLYAGSLAPHKGISVLIREFKKARIKQPLLALDIAGFGPLADELKDIAGVRLIGWQKDLSSYYQQSIAILFPSTGLESFGLVTSEAMTHGRPVIGVNRGTTAWLIEDGKTGLLFDPLREGDLAEKILRIAGNTELALKLGKNGQQRIHGLIDNDAALQGIIGIYKEALKKNPPSL